MTSVMPRTHFLSFLCYVKFVYAPRQSSWLINKCHIYSKKVFIAHIGCAKWCGNWSLSHQILERGENLIPESVPDWIHNTTTDTLPRTKSVLPRVFTFEELFILFLSTSKIMDANILQSTDPRANFLRFLSV